MIHPPTLADAQFASEALLSRLHALTDEIAGVRQAQDPESVHRMRVAARRLRNAIRLFSDFLPAKKAIAWQKQVRRLLRALGAARDADVQLAFLDRLLVLPSRRSGGDDRAWRPGVDRVRLRLRQRRTRLQAKVNGAVDIWLAAEAGTAMESKFVHLAVARADEGEGPDSHLRERAAAEIESCLRRLLTYESNVFQPEAVEALHAMRIAAKHLRYALEVYAPLFVEELNPPLRFVRKLQDALGDIHDCDVWAAWLPKFAEKERARTLDYFGHARPFARLVAGLDFLGQDRAQHRARRYQVFVEVWQEAEEQHIWDKLRQTATLHLEMQHWPD